MEKKCIEFFEQLQTFLEEDMWHSKSEEWKSKKDMFEYINTHFNICKLSIKKIDDGDIVKIVLKDLKQLQEFFEEDIWYAKDNEWKTENDMVKYIRIHFNAYKKDIKKIRIKNKLELTREQIKQIRITDLKEVFEGLKEIDESYSLYKELTVIENAIKFMEGETCTCKKESKEVKNK